MSDMQLKYDANLTLNHVITSNTVIDASSLPQATYN